MSAHALLVSSSRLLAVVLFAACGVISDTGPDAEECQGKCDDTNGDRQSVVIRVDPANGADDGPWTQGRPVASLSRALEVAADQRARGSAVTIELSGGVHWLAESVEITPAHSGTVDAPLVIRAERDGDDHANVALAGGTPLAGAWAAVPGTPLFRLQVTPGRTFRQLYVDAVRKQRARSALFPDGGLLTSAQVRQCGPVETGVEAAGYRLRQWSVQVSRPQELELVSLENWRGFRCPLTGISAGGSFLELDNSCWTKSIATGVFGVGRLAWLENAREFIDEPGEWYLDSSEGWLYYYPETPDQVSDTPSSFIAPLAERLITVRGVENAPVEHVRIEHINFAFTSWLGANRPSGYSPVQGGVYFEPCENCPSGLRGATVPGAIELEYAHDIVVSANQFHRLGGAGINLGVGTKRAIVRDNLMSDLSASAIVVGRSSPPIKFDGSFNPERAIEGHRIFRNRIQRVGQEYFDSVGIFLGYVRDVEVRRNSLTNLPYTGISVGWGWSEEPKESLGDNVIIANHIKSASQILVDSAGIYALSSQAGTEILNNFVDGVGNGLRVGELWGVRRCRSTPNVAMYLDSGSAHMKLTNNVFTNIAFHSVFSPDHPPVHGPQVDSPSSSCGKKACNIDAQLNRLYRPGNEHDELIVQNAGAP